MKVSNIQERILSNSWKPLKEFVYQYIASDGREMTQKREVYDKGDGAGVLMYNVEKKKILLTKQFRFPAFINSISDGVVTEVPAGMLDELDPEQAILKEIEEETGYRVPKVTFIGETIMTPGAVTEVVYLYKAAYDISMKVSEGGGLEDEQEDILIFEINFDDAKKMIRNNEIKDAKTLILLQHAWISGLLDS